MRKKILVLWIWLDQWRVSKDYCRGNMRHCTMRYETYSPFRCTWIIVHYLFVESRFCARRVMVRWQPGSARSMPWHKNIHPTIESSWFWNVIHVGPIWKYYIHWTHIISVWKTVLTFLRKWRCCIYMLPARKFNSLTSKSKGFSFRHSIPTDVADHPASYPVNAEGSCGRVDRSYREDDHSYLSAAEIETEWRYTSIPHTS